MSDLIQLAIEKYDDDHRIVFIEKQGKNIWSMLSLMQFEDEMEYWDMPTRIEESAGRKGFVFNNGIDSELLLGEIQRFIDEHSLEERNCFLDAD